MVNVKEIKCSMMVVGAVVVLFLVGFFAVPLLLSFSEAVVGRTILASGPGQAAAIRMSLGLLLGLCAVNGRVLLWVYSKKQIVSSVMLIYSFGLLISLLGAFAGILFNLFQLRGVPDFGIEASWSLDVISYFKWGFEGLVLVWVVVGVLLLLLSQKKKVAVL